MLPRELRWLLLESELQPRRSEGKRRSQATWTHATSLRGRMIDYWLLPFQDQISVLANKLGRPTMIHCTSVEKPLLSFCQEDLKKNRSILVREPNLS